MATRMPIETYRDNGDDEDVDVDDCVEEEEEEEEIRNKKNKKQNKILPTELICNDSKRKD